MVDKKKWWSIFDTLLYHYHLLVTTDSNHSCNTLTIYVGSDKEHNNYTNMNPVMWYGLEQNICCLVKWYMYIIHFNFFLIVDSIDLLSWCSYVNIQTHVIWLIYWHVYLFVCLSNNWRFYQLINWSIQKMLELINCQTNINWIVDW